jgi:hypothetical protein
MEAKFLSIAFLKSRGSRITRVIANGLAGIALVLLGASTYLWYSYADTRPRTAKPSEGRTYQLNTHGIVVYLTLREQIGLTAFIVTAFACAGVSMAMYKFVIGGAKY